MRIFNSTLQNTAAIFTIIGVMFTVISALVTDSYSSKTNKIKNSQIDFSSPDNKEVIQQSPLAVSVTNRMEKIIILVPPFENTTGIRSEITIDAPTNPNQNTHIRTRVVDRYAEAPRAILEDILLQFPNVVVVERQQLDKMLLESEYGRNSGLVDSKFAIEIGKQLGANSIVTGTIINIREKSKSFKGYGVTTNTKIIVSTIRIRVIDISSGQLVFSTLIEDSIPYNSSNYGGIKNSDTAFEVMYSSLNKLRSDNKFTNFFNR